MWTELKAPVVALALVSFSFRSEALVNNLSSDSAATTENSKILSERTLTALNQVLSSQSAKMGNFPYWNHVGMVGMGSGIYLGDGYVLTSAHVGCYPFRMNDGSVYKPDYKTWKVFQNPNNSKSDLAIFRVSFEGASSLASLAEIPIATKGRVDSTPILLLGTGYTQHSEVNKLTLTGSQITLPGYNVLPQRSLVWALNQSSSKVEQAIKSVNGATTQCFSTRFEEQIYSGQVVQGDSGGAAFQFNQATAKWELVGCIVATSGEKTYAAFGNKSFIADLEVYLHQMPLVAKKGN